jgi:hypothetical protein
MSKESLDVTTEYRIAEIASKAFDPGDQPDIRKLMQAAYMHGYAAALIRYSDKQTASETKNVG